MGAGQWRLDRAAHARMVAMLEALARPQEGETRSREQRLADALTEGADRVLLADDGPRAGGLPVRALVIVSEEALRDEPDSEPAVLDGYGAICNATARQLVCGADEVVVIRVRVDGTFVDLGYADGKPTPAQRLIVTARDKRCVGCGAPASRCQVHHIIWQSDGGPTVTDNLCLLCWDCHTRVHHQGWQVTRDPDGRFRLRSPLKAALEKRRTA
jgi:ferredoxin